MIPPALAILGVLDGLLKLFAVVYATRKREPGRFFWFYQAVFIYVLLICLEVSCEEVVEVFF